MSSSKRRGPLAGDEENLGYAPPFITSHRRKPRSKETGNDATPETMSQGRSLFYGTRGQDSDSQKSELGRPTASKDDEEEFSNLWHSLKTLSELYTNDLVNRARWDPRWLNITHRERFKGLQSTSVSVIEYLANDTVERSDFTESENRLANALEARPEDSMVRVIMVSDLSQFVMGALGHIYSVEPEFWVEHLANSGYSASDRGLRLKNAARLNWAERETSFRHRATPGPGQRTELNLPRRRRSHKWVHIRWGRLGLLHYLGHKGFYEDEIDKRIADGWWTMLRDVVLDKHGLLMTEKRKLRAEQKARRKKKEAEKEQRKEEKEKQEKKREEGDRK